MSTRTAILVAAAALGVLVLALARGEEPSAQLQALKADPMATYAPPGGTLVQTRSQNEGSSLGKPVSARYTRMFQIGAGTGERALERAAKAAADAGWAVGPRSTAFPDVVGADRSVPSGRIQLHVSVFRDSRILPDGVRPPALQVSLRHLGP